MTLPFAFSRFVFITNFYSLPSSLIVLARYFAFFAAFKMGVNFRTGTQFREARTYKFL